MVGTFQEILNMHASIKKKRVRSEFAPWLTPSLGKSMETRDKRRAAALKSSEMWSTSTKQRNRITKKLIIVFRIVTKV